MAFQMPEIQNNIGNALANIGQIRQQRTQNALAERQAAMQERQFALTEGAQRRQQQQFDTEQAAATRARVEGQMKNVAMALYRMDEGARGQGLQQLQSDPRFADLPPQAWQFLASRPEALSTANLTTFLNSGGDLTPDQRRSDEAALARAKTVPRYSIRDSAGEIIGVNEYDPTDVVGTGRAPKPPAPPQPAAVIYQQGPQAPSFVDAQGRPVPTVFNPRTGQYEAAQVTPGLTPAPKPPPNMTDGQSKALLFGSRMRESNAILDQLAAEGVTALPLGYRAASETPVLGAAVVANSSEATQSLDQAQRDFINAVLRRESGASISPQEFDNADRQYFPQPNEGPRVIEQKRRARELALQGILAEVPEARRDSVRPPGQVPRIKTPAEWQALPRGTRYVDPQGVERVKN